MGVVNINGVNVTIMGTLLGAQQYLEGAIGAGAVAWRALVDAGDDDQQGRLLAQATRTLYALGWQGTPTVANQRTAFPRNGVQDKYGQPLADGSTPQDVIEAEYELAAAFAANPSAKDAANTGSNVKRLEAGPVNIEYHRPTDQLASSTPLPKVAWDLIAPYLGGAIGDDASAARAYGVDPCCEPAAASQFEDCDEYTRVVR